MSLSVRRGAFAHPGLVGGAAKADSGDTETTYGGGVPRAVVTLPVLASP